MPLYNCEWRGCICGVFGRWLQARAWYMYVRQQMRLRPNPGCSKRPLLCTTTPAVPAACLACTAPMRDTRVFMGRQYVAFPGAAVTAAEATALCQQDVPGSALAAPTDADQSSFVERYMMTPYAAWQVRRGALWCGAVCREGWEAQRREPDRICDQEPRTCRCLQSCEVSGSREA